MFPIRDHNPSRRTPIVTWALMAVNILIFIGYWPLFDDPHALNAFFNTWAMIPAEISSGQAYQTLISSMFLHGGWMHLLGNMLFLWIFGDNLEDEMGHLPYLGFYLASGIGAGLAQIFWDPSNTIPNVGASGAIAGVMGGYLLLFPKARVDILLIFIVFFRVFPVPAWVMLGVWFTLQLVSGLVSPTDMGGVAYWAHAGGFLVGALLTYPLFSRLGGPKFWHRTHGHPPHPEASYPFVKTRIPTVKRR